MSQQGRKFGGQKRNDENISDKVRKMKERQKLWMQEREVAKVSETKSGRSSSASKQSRKKPKSASDSTNKSTSLAWISKDDYQLSGKRSGGRNTTTQTTQAAPQTASRKSIFSRETGYTNSQNKGGESHRSRESRRSETSITGYDDGELKSTRTHNFVNQYEHTSGKYSSQNEYSSKDLTSESFSTLADRITERLQVQEKDRRESNEAMTTMESKNEKLMSTHICSGCDTLMAPPQHSPIAIIPCGHTFCQICVSNYSKCPQCQTEIFSTAPNTVIQQIIEDFRKKQEKERLKQLEEQTRKYVEEYQNLNLRCEGLAEEADRILNAMEAITEDIIEEKRVSRKLEKENDGIKSKIKELELEFHQNEELMKESSSNCQVLEQNYNDEKEKLTLIEQTIKTIRNSKERAKIMIQNLAPNLKIDDSF